MKLAALFLAYEASVTYLALSETVQAASIAAVASVANTALLVYGRRDAREAKVREGEAKEAREAIHTELARLRRAQTTKRMSTRGQGEGVLVVEVPEDMDVDP